MSNDKTQPNTDLVIDSSEEWTFDKLEQMYEQVEKIAIDEFGLDVYPNRLETISAEQMIDAMCAAGMPINYSHWSFGEQFVKEYEAYKRGYMGLAYEIVINSNPCISYLMEENTMLMQTLVTAHAAFGHNHFFKNNYLFKEWTRASAILDYMSFAKKYVAECDERYGTSRVEAILDAAHALKWHGVDKYKRPGELSAKEEENRRQKREEIIQKQLDLVWSTIPNYKLRDSKEKKEESNFPEEPQENLLYFIEKNAPRLETWERELIRIVRKISQYFYPQIQTKLMNEGCATYFHYKIMHELYNRGIVTNGAMMEFYSSHSNVLTQLFPTEHKRYNGINPYALGFAIFRDIERICTAPTDEDYQWFHRQGWVGNNDPIETIKWAIANFKDESFIQQFLSPKVIRDFKLFTLHDDYRDDMYEVASIHDYSGYRHIRNKLSYQYNIGNMIPNIQVFNVNRWGDRSMTLNHYMVNDQHLDTESTAETLQHINFLWGYDIVLDSIGRDNSIQAEYISTNGDVSLDIFYTED